MDKIYIDLTNVTLRESFWDKVCEAFECPEYFGKNLDALHDILSELDGPIEIVFINMSAFKKVLPGYVAALDEMLSDLVIECDNIFVSYEDEEEMN